VLRFPRASYTWRSLRGGRFALPLPLCRCLRLRGDAWVAGPRSAFLPVGTAVLAWLDAHPLALSGASLEIG